MQMNAGSHTRILNTLEQSEAVKKDSDFSARPSQPENVHLQCRGKTQSDEMSPELQILMLTR